MTKKEETAVAKRGTTALAVPQDLQAPDDQKRFEQEDLILPRLGLAQSNSPQVKKGNAKRIEGLAEGQLFNTLTGDIYGEGPLAFVVVKFLGKRAIEFASMDEGGGVVDFNVPLTRDPKTNAYVDDRMRFGADGEKPRATLFYEYLVWLPDSGEAVVLSMKGTQLKIAKSLNAQLDYPLLVDGQRVARPARWARTFALGVASQQKDNYQWVNFTVKQQGITPPETRAQCAELYASLSSRQVVTDYDESETEDAEPVKDEDTPF